MTYTFWAFFLAAYSFDSLSKSIKTCGFVAAIIGLILWPLFLARFLYKKKDVLDTQEVKQKHQTIYDGIEIDSKLSLFYNAIFCIRRFDIVLINVVFSGNFPVKLVEGNSFLYKILFFLGIQSAYVIYIIDSWPHTESHFNTLELFNESLLILLTFIMICYCGIGDSQMQEEI